MPTELAGQGAHHGNRDDELHGVRCCNEARTGFVLKMPSSEVAHIEEGFGLLARRCPTRNSDPIYGDLRRPDAQPLVWMSVRWTGVRAT